MDQKDEIKEKTDLVELIREYVPLKAVGVNFQALCPFHREKTPSFVVSGERQIWKCFGCGKGGDAFSFVMEMEGLSFPEALRQLAPKAGVTLRRQNVKETSRRNRLLDCMAYAVNYCHRVLRETSEVQAARDYLHKRGVTDDVIEEFKIGFSRDSWDDLYLALRQKGFSDEDIFLAGLTVKKDKGLGYYNRFRGRIMFPINDVNGNPVGFSARVSPEREATEKMGKYINSPISPLYDKSTILFNLDKAKQHVRHEEKIIVVEGQMDVISSYRVGVKNIVASSGTALTDNQLKLIRRYTADILMSFDADSAGQQAAERGIVAALRADMNVRVIQVPGGKDPDECIREHPDHWRKAIRGAVSVMDYYFARATAGRDLNDIADKKAVAAKLLGVITHIASPIERDTWLRRLAETLMVREDSLRAALQAHAAKAQPSRSQRAAGVPPAAPVRSEHSQTAVLSDSLLALALRFFPLFAQVIRTVTPEMLAPRLNLEFYKMLVMYYSSSIQRQELFDRDGFLHWLTRNIQDEQQLAGMEELTDTLLLLADRDFYDTELPNARHQLTRISAQLKGAYLDIRLARAEQELVAAERQGEGQRVSALMEQVRSLIYEKKRLGA